MVEPFIDDSFDVEEENRRTPLSAFPEDIEGESEEDEEFWHNALQRSKENARNNCWAPNTTSTSSILERFHAFEGDYPLWQVRCRVRQTPLHFPWRISITNVATDWL